MGGHHSVLQAEVAVILRCMFNQLMWPRKLGKGHSISEERPVRKIGMFMGFLNLFH